MRQRYLLAVLLIGVFLVLACNPAPTPGPGTGETTPGAADGGETPTRGPSPTPRETLSLDDFPGDRWEAEYTLNANITCFESHATGTLEMVLEASGDSFSGAARMDDVLVSEGELGCRRVPGPNWFRVEGEVRRTRSDGSKRIALFFYAPQGNEPLLDASGVLQEDESLIVGGLSNENNSASGEIRLAKEGSPSSLTVVTTPIPEGTPAPQSVTELALEHAGGVGVSIEDVTVTSVTPITKANREVALRELVEGIKVTYAGDGAFLSVPLEGGDIFESLRLEDLPSEFGDFLRKAVAREGNQLLNLEWGDGQSGSSVAQSMAVATEDGIPLFDTMAFFKPMTVNLLPHPTHGHAGGVGTLRSPSRYEIDTHAAIVDEMFDLIGWLDDSEKYRELLGTATPREMVRKGALEEDDGLRWLYHFEGMEWADFMNLSPSKLIAGETIPEGVRSELVTMAAEGALAGRLLDPEGHGLMTDADAPLTLMSAKDWAREQRPVDGTDEYTWGGAIEAYSRDGNRTLAFERLGHIVHLLQDMGQPDHGAGRAHPGSGFTLAELRQRLEGQGPRAPILPEDLPDDAMGFERYWAEQTEHGRVADIGETVTETVKLQEMEEFFDSLRQRSLSLGGNVLSTQGDDAFGLRSTDVLHLFFADWLEDPVKGSILSGVAGGIDLAGLKRVEGIPMRLKEPANLIPSIDPQDPGPYDSFGEALIQDTIRHGAGLVQFFYDIVNPPPTVDTVEVVQEAEKKYGRSVGDASAQDQGLCAGEEAFVNIWFGPEKWRDRFHVMDPESITVTANGTPVEFSHYDDGGDQPLWSGSFTVPYLADEVEFSISASDGRNHYGGRSDPGYQLDSDPSTRPYMSETKAPYAWADYEPGPDTNHTAKVVGCGDEGGTPPEPLPQEARSCQWPPQSPPLPLPPGPEVTTTVRDPLPRAQMPRGTQLLSVVEHRYTEEDGDDRLVIVAEVMNGSGDQYLSLDDDMFVEFRDDQGEKVRRDRTGLDAYGTSYAGLMTVAPGERVAYVGSWRNLDPYADYVFGFEDDDVSVADAPSPSGDLDILRTLITPKGLSPADESTGERTYRQYEMQAVVRASGGAQAVDGARVTYYNDDGIAVGAGQHGRDWSLEPNQDRLVRWTGRSGNFQFALPEYLRDDPSPGYVLSMWDADEDAVLAEKGGCLVAPELEVVSSQVHATPPAWYVPEGYSGYTVRSNNYMFGFISGKVANTGDVSVDVFWSVSIALDNGSETSAWLTKGVLLPGEEAAFLATISTTQFPPKPGADAWEPGDLPGRLPGYTFAWFASSPPKATLEDPTDPGGVDVELDPRLSCCGYDRAGWWGSLTVSNSTQEEQVRTVSLTAYDGDTVVYAKQFTVALNAGETKRHSYSVRVSVNPDSQSRLRWEVDIACLEFQGCRRDG